MRPTPLRFSRPLLTAGLLAAAMCCPSRAAHAQAGMGVDPGLDGFYKPGKWIPVRLSLSNQGAAARVNVEATLGFTPEGGTVYRYPDRTLPNGANEVHTLYVRDTGAFGGQSLLVTMRREGRVVGRPFRQNLRAVSGGDWLITAFGSDRFLATMKRLNGAQHPRGPGQPAGSFAPQSNVASVSVATLPVNKIPDRWQGLSAADVVFVGDVSERDFAPEQLQSLRDYVVSGGTLVVTGGDGTLSLAGPFFRELIPVTVRGTYAADVTGALGRGRDAAGPVGTALISDVRPKPGAQVRLRVRDGHPLSVVGQRGGGCVVFLGFDPGQSPFREWDGLTGQLTSTLDVPGSGTLFDQFGQDDAGDDRYQAAYSGRYSENQLARAPYGIAQLDIPAFYLVALFMVAYVVVLVPVNYFILRKLDKKELAWLTTPLIVILFSVGAYVIGYGIKGGRTLIARVGVAEAWVGDDTASAVTFSGLFSPSRASYDLQLANSDPGAQSEASSTLLSYPFSSRSAPRQVYVQDETQRLLGFPVDMWAMQILRTEGLLRLSTPGRAGFAGDLQIRRGRLTGSLRNDGRATIESAYLIEGDGLARSLGDVPPGKVISIDALSSPGSVGIPGDAFTGLTGKGEQSRIRRTVLESVLKSQQWGAGAVGPLQDTGPRIIGWLREPIGRLKANGAIPREQTATLFVLHLQRQPASP